MSWEPHIASLATYTGNKMLFGGIYGHDGNVWVKRGDLNVTKAEAELVSKVCAHSSSELAKAQGEGIRLDDKKFKFLRSDEETKGFAFTRNEGEKLHNGYAMRTKQSVILCVVEEEGKGNAACNATCKLAEFFESTGY